jgi:DNA-directed RNA polymerase specialized sigma24 family protein
VPTLAVTVTRFAVMHAPATLISGFAGVKARACFEKELVALARKGDQKAFVRLFSLHQKRVYALSLSLLKNVPEAESLTQEIFLNAFRRLKDLRDDAAFSTFISRSLWEAVLRFKCTSQDTSSSAVELTASNFQTASAALTQLEA